MATKIIKFNNGTYTYAPVTLASAVQYSYTGGVMSVQDALGTVAQAVINTTTPITTKLNAHFTQSVSLSSAANSTSVSLGGTAHDATGSVEFKGGDNITVSGTTADKIFVSAYGVSKSDHNHNIGFTGDITLSSTSLGTSLSPTVNKSTNIKNGAKNSIPVQKDANTTGFISAPSGAARKVLSYSNGTISWSDDVDHKLTSATITPKSSAESIAVTTYSVDVLKSNTITMSGTDGESVTATNVQHYTVPTQNAIDKAKAEAIAHANSLVVSAMNYRGVTSTSLTDGATTNPVTITSGPSTGSVTCVSGDIVLDGTGADKKEYIWNGTSWNELGDASAKANKTTKIISDNTAIVVTDETLADDVHIAHETSSAGTTDVTANNKNVTGATGQQKVITGITVNSYGHVTSYTAANIYSTDTKSTISGEYRSALKSAYVKLTNNTGEVGIYNAGAASDAGVILSYTLGKGIGIKITYTDTNTHVGTHTLSASGTSNPTISLGGTDSSGSVQFKAGTLTSVTYSSTNGVQVNHTVPTAGSVTATSTKTIDIAKDTYGHVTAVSKVDIATMTAATASAPGTKGFVPEPPAGSQNKVLTGAAEFKAISAFQYAHATGLLYKTMDTTEEFTLFDDTKFTGVPVSLATITSPAITVSLS